MNRAHQYMKLFVDKHRRATELEEGELVLVKLQPYRHHFVGLSKNHKLGMRYFGPFSIIKKLKAPWLINYSYQKKLRYIMCFTFSC